MRWQQALMASVFLAFPLLWLLFQGFGHDPHAVPFALKNQVAPDFALQEIGPSLGTSGQLTMDGNRLYKLSDFKGKVVLINFWSTWCVPCQMEHGMLQQAARYYGDKLQILGIVYQDDPQSVATFLQTRPSNYPQLLDKQSQVALDYGVSGVPESYVIDKAGVLRFKQPGMVDKKFFQTWLEPLL